MAKKSGVDEVSRPLPGGGGGVRAIGDAFQPNLAMGGGSYRIPLDLPHGPGGVTPRLDLSYHTGYGNGYFGQGWGLGVPFIELRRSSPFQPLGATEYTLSGALVLVPLADGGFVPYSGAAHQVFRPDGEGWLCRTPSLVETRFGTTAEGRLTAPVDGSIRTVRWYLQSATYPGGVRVEYDYERVGAEHLLRRLRWSVWRLELEYEARPDPFSSYGTGFEVRTAQRCRRLALHHDGIGAETLVRSWTLAYAQAPAVGTSLLQSLTLSAWHTEDGSRVETRLAPLRFEYTEFKPERRGITRFRASVVPPPPLSEDVTLLDYRGSSLPGVLRMTGDGATYWENRGNGLWGPPEALRTLPSGLHLGDDRLRFADLTGNGTADLIVAEAAGGGFWEHDPEHGFVRKRRAMLTPGFALDDPDSRLLDVDGDGIVDLLTFRNGELLAFLNDRGNAWRGPVVLPGGPLPRGMINDPRTRFADMNGDGSADVVLLRSREVVYWPALGGGQWGSPRRMADTPEFDVPEPDTAVFLHDVDGDGTADLVLIGSGSIRLYLNSGGERFGPPIELQRTPPLSADKVLFADMTGSGTAGVLWTGGPELRGDAGYAYLDLHGGLKPYLLSSINNGAGLQTTIEYTTSAFERAADLAEGRRWSGYLPFAVHVVKRTSTRDAVTGHVSTTEFRYHDGNYDGLSREWLGFARVEAQELATPQEAAVLQRYFFHNRAETATDSKYVASRGQPHRNEVINPDTGKVCQVEESSWTALPVAGTLEDHEAYLSVEESRSSRRLDGDDIYEREHIAFRYDQVGNVVREHRRGDWTDSAGTTHVDELVIETSYAVHPAYGLTSLPCRLRRTNGNGRVLKSFDFFYDGAPFVGLPFGQVENGFRTRQAEIALTMQHVAEAYGTVPPLLDSLYRAEIDPDLGPVWIKDTRRYRVDSVGNQVETLDALGHAVFITYDADGILPIRKSEDGGPDRQLEFDRVAQQATLIEDLNGNILRTEYDGLGSIRRVFRHGALPDKPTETYEYVRDALPHRTIQQVRVSPEDVLPGWEQRSYLDGFGRSAQVRVRTADGRWAVGLAAVLSPAGRKLVERDSYFSTSPDFEPSPPPGLAHRELRYDFAHRIAEETLFGGGRTTYRYVRNETRFYDPDATLRLDNNLLTPPSRTSRCDAWGRVIAIEERDAAGTYEERRSYDPLGQLVRVVDTLGGITLDSTLDCWGNRIRVRSAEAGTTTFVYDAGNNEVLRTDADGRTCYQAHDRRCRLTEIRRDGPEGPIEETRSYDVGVGENLSGRLATVNGAFGTVEYSYSAEGDATRVTRTFAGDPATYVVEFGYDTQRKVRFVRYPDSHLVTYGYTPDGLLNSISGVIDSIDYGAEGKRRRIVFTNGLETRRDYTPGDHLLREIVTAPLGGGPTYQHLVHHLDAVGRVTRIDDLSTVAGKIRNNQTFEYDARNRLIHATGRGATTYAFDYAYDALGNLVFSGESFGEPIDYGHHVGDAEHPNRLVKRAAATSPEFQFDASGNLTRDPQLGELQYDVRHRLIRIERPDGTIVEYDYDHTDRRVVTRVTADGTTRTRIEVEGIYIVESTGTTRVVFDEDRRLAVLPSAGDGLLHHLDRIGNVNVVSNLNTGAFVGHDEYTPWGQLSVSIAIQPHYTFQGAALTDGVDIVLLGVRWYRPALARFLTPDRYLLVKQERVPGILAGSNLYLYALDNPSNFSDPSGRLAFLAVLAIAAVIGAVLGLVGAAVNGVQTWDEFLLWVIGGAIGGVLAVLGWTAVILGFTTLSAGSAATAALVLYTVASIVGALVTPGLDESDSEGLWVFSFMLKVAQSPLTTLVGLYAARIVGAIGGDVDFRRGMLFIEVGPGGGALTLGAVAWTRDRNFTNGNVSDALARHEAHHSRTIAAIGELGFYFTYVRVGALWGAAEGSGWASWNDLSAGGCGNPFEKTGHTYTGDPPNARPTFSGSSC